MNYNEVFGRDALQPVALFPTPLRYRESESFQSRYVVVALVIIDD